MNRKISILFGTVFTALFLQSAAIAYLVFQQTTLMRLVGGVEGSIAVGNGLTNVIGGEGTHGSWNTALGMNALMESTTAWAQTAVGFNALRDSGTGKGAVGTGVFGNTAVGYNSMVVNTEGYDNTAVGVNTLLNNLTGNDNSAFGINALRNNRNGYDNTAIGYDTLMNLSDGFQNVALGGMAGRFYDGETEKSLGRNSIYIGFQAYGGPEDNADNEIVIGSGAVGKGSNTTVLGSERTTTTYIAGELSIRKPASKNIRPNLAFDPESGAIVVTVP